LITNPPGQVSVGGNEMEYETKKKNMMMFGLSCWSFAKVCSSIKKKGQ
jgi:hypothetical protein